MMSLQEIAMRQALEALESNFIVGCTAWRTQRVQAITSLRRVLDDQSTESVMIDMSPPATLRDRWMYEQGRLAERDPRTHSATTSTHSTLDCDQPTKLEDNEQYRMQMAGISTAALGYWKEGDSIHPDYDTPALHDVAKLYADYARLFAELVDMVITYPKFTTWSNNEGDSWYEDPADAQIIYDAFGDDPKVGDTFTLMARGSYAEATYKIMEVSEEGECEVDCISHPHEHIPPATYCPPGWKLVPVEPTNDMLTAWFRCDRWSRDGSWQEAYRDMLTAAPDVPMQQPNGMVLVPKRMTAAMRHVTDQEGWTWEDLLASAEAITESEYIHLNTGRPQSQ